MRAILSVRNSFIATKEPVLTLAASLAGIGGKEGDNSIGVDGGSGRDGCVCPPQEPMRAVEELLEGCCLRALLKGVQRQLRWVGALRPVDDLIITTMIIIKRTDYHCLLKVIIMGNKGIINNTNIGNIHIYRLYLLYIFSVCMWFHAVRGGDNMAP